MDETRKVLRSAAPSRRGFLKASALAAGAALGSVPLVNVLGQETKRKFRVGLIGCGGRGNGAANDFREAIKYCNDKLGWQLDVEYVAMGDWFKGRAEGAGKRYGVPADRCFGGGDNHQKVLDQNPDVVLLAEPPVFRPRNIEAAVKAGKHIFTEKPVAVDPEGVRRVLAAGEEATRKGLGIVAGTQRRHERGYNQRALEIKDGAYGKILAGRVAWNMGRIFGNTPINPTSPDQLCGPWQLWVEMSGDHICEQHVHNLDIANWYIGTHPQSAGGFGFRARRIAGNMYDFFSVDLEYPGGVYVHSMCRQVADCWNWVGESFVYERTKPRDWEPETPDPYEEVGYPPNAYVSEHAHLIWSIVRGKPLNEAQNVAWATGAAILARESAYTGKRITWREMFEDPSGAFYKLNFRPTAEDFEKDDVPLLEDGAIRIPGVPS
jgi:myo-inositol 2-dehydrogenase / D-chiro-inositol 1-dehydrogenase